jgi:hypothetical protein
VHALPEQSAWFWQTCPQPPQFAGSTCVFAHRPLHEVAPVHWHALPEQVAWPGVTPVPAHANPHVLQLSGSIARSTHSPGAVPHVVGSVTGHSQVPALHEPAVGQRWPQAPQLFTSGAAPPVPWTSTHWLLQHVSLAPQAWPQAPQLPGSEPPSRQRSPHLMDG